MAIEPSGAYYIDADYHVVDVNTTAQRLYPRLAVGQKCFRCLRGKEQPCEDCPVVNQVAGPKHYFNPIRNGYETVEALEMPLPDGTMGHAIVFGAAAEHAAPPEDEAADLRWLGAIRSLGSTTVIFLTWTAPRALRLPIGQSRFSRSWAV